jgi:hypothetical protein
MFEYALKPADKLDPAEKSAMERVRIINKNAAMPALNEFVMGTMEGKLAQAGFKDIHVETITDRMMPMLERFYRKAKLPYSIIKALKLEKHFPNAMSAVEFYENKSIWRYDVITCSKPK